MRDKLEDVQKRSARFITSDYSYEPGSMTRIYEELKLPPLAERRKNNRLILLFKGLNNRASIPIEILSRPTRYTKNMHQEHLNRIYARTDILKYSFLPKTITDWNSLPPDIFSKVQSAQDPVTTFSKIIKGGVE